MDDEGLVLLAPRRRRLEAPDVGAVTELRLSIAANVLVVLRFLEEAFMLLRVSLVAERDLRGFNRLNRGFFSHRVPAACT